MADRSVLVRLRADVSDFNRGLAQASARVKQSAGDFEKFSIKNERDMTKVGQAGIAMGAAMALGVGAALKTFADFDAKMSSVQAATGETAAAMGKLRDAALDAGARTVFSATEAADAIEQLAKAGVSTEAILGGGLNGALDLAAAGSMDVGAAAEIAATAMTQFGLAGSQIPHVADLLAAAAGKAQGEVSDMGQALKQSGLVAAQTGLSIEETTAALASFASAGLIGSDAGTSLKTMLQRLTPTSNEAKGAMEDLGISAYDAQGNFIGLEEFAANLRTGMSGLTVEQRNLAMATIFGSDAVRAASVLYEQGAAGIAEWTAKVDDAGYAQEVAAVKLDNLKGDIEAFLGSLETALIKTGESGNGLSRAVVQQATEMVNSYGSMSGAAQGTVLAMGGAVAAAGLLGGGFLVLAPRIVETRQAMESLSQQMPRAADRMSRLGKAAGIATVLLAVYEAASLLDSALGPAAPSVDKLTESLIDLAETGELTGEAARILGDDVKTLQDALNNSDASGFSGFMDSLGSALNPFSDRMDVAKERVTAVGDALAGLVDRGRADVAAEALERLGMSVEEGKEAFPAYADALARMESEAALAADAEAQMGDAVGDATGKVKEQVLTLVDLQKAAQSASDAVLGLRGSVRSYESAIDAADEALKKNGKTLDVNSEKGRANEAALDAIAASAGDVLRQMVESDRPIGQVTAKFKDQRGALIRAAEGFGMTSAQAKAYADSVLRIPSKQETAIYLQGVQGAMSQVERLRQSLGALKDKSIIVRVDQVNGITVQRGLGGKITERASGGIIPGTPSSVDNTLIAAATGEYVINAAQTTKHRALLEVINRGQLSAFATGGLVGGGNPLPRGATLAGQAGRVAKTGGVEAVRELVAQWQAYNEQLEQAARRQELVSGQRAARREYDTAKGIRARTEALGRLNEATKDLREFDAAARVDKERAAVEKLITKLEVEKDRREKAADLAKEQREKAAQAAKDAADEVRSIEDNMHTVGVTSTADRIALLDRRLKAEKQYSDAWTAIWRERQQILDQVADAERKTADELAKALETARDEQARALDGLNRLLDQEQQIRGRIGQSSRDFAAARARLDQRGVDEARKYEQAQQALRDQQVDAEREHLHQMHTAAVAFTDDQARLLADRRDRLASATALDQAIDFRRGLPADWLVANAREQVEALTEWMDELDLARRMGVSEQVIAALGLDEGPQALAQVRALTRASAAEIDALNDATERRTQVAGAQVRREQVGNFGQLGQALTQAQQQYATAVAGLQSDYRAGQERFAAQLLELQAGYRAQQQQLADDMAALQADFAAEQQSLTAELARIGQEQGRSYGEALALGLLSQIPAVRAAAAELAAAMGIAAPAGPTAAPWTPGRAGTTGPPAPGANSWSVSTGRVPVFYQQAADSGGRTVNVMPNAQVTIRETMDVDVAARRMEFLAATGLL